MKKNIIITILSILLIVAVGYIAYDKVYLQTKTDETTPTTENTENNETTENSTITENNEEIIDTTGMINITKAGISELDVVPSFIVGKYVNKNDSSAYFEIKSNGEVVLSEPSGGEKLYNYNAGAIRLNIYYYDKVNNETNLEQYHEYQKMVLEFIPTEDSGKEFHYITSLGNKDNEVTCFGTLENTPTSNAGECNYIKQ